MKLTKIKIAAFAMVLSTAALAVPTIHRVKHAPLVANPAAIIDINSASASELASINGLGKKRAAAIVAYRQQHGSFMSIDALTQVKGVGSKLLKRIKQKNPGRLKIGQ